MEMGALRTSDRRMEIYFGSYKSVFIPFFEAIDAKAVISLWRMRKTLWQDTLAHYYDVAQKDQFKGALWSLGDRKGLVPGCPVLRTPVLRLPL